MWKEKMTCHNLAKNKLSNLRTFPYFSFLVFSSHIKQMLLVIVYVLLHVSYVTKLWGHEVTACSAYDSNSLASLVICANLSQL